MSPASKPDQPSKSTCRTKPGFWGKLSGSILAVGLLLNLTAFLFLSGILESSFSPVTAVPTSTIIDIEEISLTPFTPTPFQPLPTDTPTPTATPTRRLPLPHFHTYEYPLANQHSTSPSHQYASATGQWDSQSASISGITGSIKVTHSPANLVLLWIGQTILEFQ